VQGLLGVVIGAWAKNFSRPAGFLLKKPENQSKQSRFAGSNFDHR
jgi:hypothetical protein